MALPSGDTFGWGAAVLTVTTTKQQLALDPHTRVQLLKNTGSVTIYLGGSDITNANTATDAYPLAAGETISMAAQTGGEALTVALYAVTASSTSTLAVLRGDV